MKENAVLRSGLCFNCLGNHKVKNCDKDINCRSPTIPKHFYLLHQAYVINCKGSRVSKNYQSVSNNASFKATVQVRGDKVESNKVALSRVVAAKIINSRVVNRN